MKSKSLYKDLMKQLSNSNTNSDIDVQMEILQDENDERADEVIVEDNNYKRARLAMSNWKLIFELVDSEFECIQRHSCQLLDEIFLLTMDWPQGKFVATIQNYESVMDAISNHSPFRNSIFNVPLNQIPTNLKCPMTQLPIVIVELMRLLGQQNCLKMLGAFRIESADNKIAELEQVICSGTETGPAKLADLSIINRMSLLKRFFRNIPGQLVGRCITDLLYRISMSFESSPCINTILRWELSCLPLCNYKALAFICLLLNSYAKYEALNLMTAESLAICWAPILFDVDANIEQISRITRILSMLIKKWDEFFFYSMI
jgi:hypothetical protein